MIDPATLTLGGLAGVTDANTAGDKASLGEDFDDFLRLLTTQLQNQDPLNPLESKEFTDQLVGFSQLEQQIAMNDKLQSISNINEASLVNSAVSFIGKTVRYEGSFFNHDGSSEMDATYFVSKPAQQVKITVLDENKNVVFSQDGVTAQGEHEFTWNGLDNDGQPVDPGKYQLQIGAIDNAGEAIQTSSLVPGTVDGVEIIEGNVFLIMDELLIGLDSVLSVRG